MSDIHHACARAGRDVRTVSDVRTAARDLQALGPTAVLVKGGHVPPEGGSSTLVDVLCIDDETVDLPTPRITTANTHGTGCTLASAVAAYLARGAPVVHAVKMAQRYVAGVLASSARLQLGGGGVQGAMDHGGRLCLQAALPPAGAPDYSLYVVTDAACNARSGRTMRQAVTAAVAGGATVVQIRCVATANCLLHVVCKSIVRSVCALSLLPCPALAVTAWHGSGHRSAVSEVSCKLASRPGQTQECTAAVKLLTRGKRCRSAVACGTS